MMFTAHHIVSAVSSETGIAGALQHHVLSFTTKLSVAKGVEESKSKIKSNFISKK